MNRFISSLLLGSLLLPGLAACSSPASSQERLSTADVHGKPAAPVVIEAELRDSSARVTVRFEAAVRGARIDVHGVDGLVVTSDATLLESTDLEAGATRTFEVGFTPGAGRSHLVVTVTGAFAGGSDARVASFSVGSDPGFRSASGTRTIGGERIRLQPVDGR